MTPREVRTLLEDVLKEHPAPWSPDGKRFIRRGVLSEARDGDHDGTYPEERDIVDATGGRVVERDCGLYEPHGATFRFIVQAPTIVTTLLTYIDDRQAYNESFPKTARLIEAQLKQSEERRDAACRANVRLADQLLNAKAVAEAHDTETRDLHLELETARARIRELEAELIAKRIEKQGPSHGEY